MIHFLATKIANRIFDENDRYPMDVYVYGIELLISMVTGTCLVLLAGLLTGSFIQSVIYLVSFSLIRIYTGGYHAATYLRCNILTVLSYIAVFLSVHFLGEYFRLPYVMLSGFVLTFVLALIFAPVKHENKEMTEKEAGKYKLLALLMITVIYALCSALFYFASITEALIIFPTCITVDIAMAVSVIKNHINSRRSNHEKLRKEDDGKSSHQSS